MAILGGKRRVIMMGGEGVVLFSPSGNGMVRETSFSWEVPDFEQRLAEALGEQNRSKSVVMLFDGADQTYRREENIPKLSAIDRPRFVKRKLELAFPAYSVRGALEIKPSKVKGAAAGTPSYLFVALPETENLERVGRAVFDSGVPVSGFGLLPTESASLVSELAEKVFNGNGKKSRWAVLIGQHETGGLRQVVTKDGNLALTRLTPPSEAGTSGASWAENVTREFKATMTYVSRFGFNPNEGMDVMIICGAVEKQFFNEQEMEDVQNFRCLTISEALKQIGVSTIAFDKGNFADVVHAAWVGKKQKLAFPITLPSIQKIMGPRQMVRYGSAGLLVSAIALLGLGAHSYYGYQVLQNDIQQKQNGKAILEREYQQEAKVFEGLPVKPEVVTATLAVKTLTEKNSVNYALFMSKLKDALGDDILLEELTFNHATDAALPIEQPGASSSSSSSPAAADPGLNPAPVPAVPLPTDRGSVRIGFKFNLPETMTLEQKVTRAEKALADLTSAFAGYKVTLISQFGKITRDGKFTGDVVAQNAPSGQEISTPVSQDLAEFLLEGPGQ